MNRPVKRVKPWNRCDVCGKLISFRDFQDGKASRKMISTDSECSKEEFETLCKYHSNPNKPL